METRDDRLRALAVRLRDIDDHFERLQRRVAELDAPSGAGCEQSDGTPLEALESERDALQSQIDRLARIGDDSWRLLTGEISEALSSLTVHMVETKERLEEDLDP